MNGTPRTYETGIQKKFQDFPVEDGFTAGKGGALFESGGKVGPYRDGAQFAGFCEGTYSPEKLCPMTRGSIVLRIPGASDRDRGRVVYASGENSFSLSGKKGCPIGKIRHCESERCAVAFKRTGDPEPLNLEV